jgi:hypothetical protein
MGEKKQKKLKAQEACVCVCMPFKKNYIYYCKSIKGYFFKLSLEVVI